MTEHSYLSKVVVFYSSVKYPEVEMMDNMVVLFFFN